MCITLDSNDLLRRLKTSTDKKNKNRKYGRNGRRAKHRVGTTCAMKNCDKLIESRKYDIALGCYVAR